MKKFIYAIAFLAAFTFASCTDLEDDESNIENTSAVEKDRVDPRDGD